MSTKKTFVFSRTKGGDPYVVPPVDMFHINIDNNGQLEVIDHKSNVINQFLVPKLLQVKQKLTLVNSLFIAKSSPSKTQT